MWHMHCLLSLRTELRSWSRDQRWRHQMETFSELLAICAGNSPAPGEFLAQRPVTRSFDVFFDLRLNKRLSKQSRGWWFETLSCPLWRHRNAGTAVRPSSPFLSLPRRVLICIAESFLFKLQYPAVYETRCTVNTKYHYLVSFVQRHYIHKYALFPIKTDW